MDALVYLGTRLQSKAGSGQRSQGGHGGTGAGFPVVCPEQGLGPVVAPVPVFVLAPAPVPAFGPVPVPVPAFALALAPAGLDGGTT